MLITFRSKASSNITMFGDTAVILLKMMGHSSTVPGSLPSEKIPMAIENLTHGLALQPAKLNPAADPGDDESPISLRQRAYPLLQLLSAAAAQGCSVTWDGNQ